MPIGYVYDPIFLMHDLPAHPENAGRLREVHRRLEAAGLLARLTQVPATPVDLALLERVHSPQYRERVERAARRGEHLDADTYTTPKSYQAALCAAGGLVNLTQAVLAGDLSAGFALVRPPGHHARAGRAMGFCLFNNIAIAARHALDAGLQRILIVDYDVHHGNGTQDAFYAQSDILFFSTHQYPHYPGTGNMREKGVGEGEGYTVNVPLRHGAGDASFRTVFERLLEPLASRYQPELILVSAGFDGHWRDPLAGLALSLAGYDWLNRFLIELAGELCGGRLVLTLEGGYDTAVLADGVANTFRRLLGDDDAAIVDPWGPDPSAGDDAGALVEQLRSLHGLSE